MSAPSQPGAPDSLPPFDPNTTLGLLYDISRELTSILDRDQLFARIAERVRTVVDYCLFAVMMWSEERQQLENVFAVHYNVSIPARFCVPLFKGITGHAAGERKAVRVDDVRLDPRYIEMPNAELVRSEMVIPLMLQERLVGVLDLESVKVGAFTAENERMLGILSSYIAIALENSRLYVETREHEQRLQSDLDTAREVQLQLLPQGVPDIRGLDISANYLPARDLGGDFYDVLPYGEHHAALVLGDVSGKGTAAALYGSLAIGTLRENTRRTDRMPAQMLDVLNRRLCGSGISPGFVAMLFTVFDSTKNHLIIGNGGIPHPTLVRDGVVVDVPIDGTPLGLFRDIEYAEHTIKMQPDDIVVLASDGITESMNAAGELFGVERLAALLRQFSTAGARTTASSAEIAAAILKATDVFSGMPSEPHDDRTLIVLRLAKEEANGKV
ncbi:MAG TPA: GAF domain-containing SpoIIE family protein phosphatase [Candidatus Acidoferrales bacterium]